MRQKKARREDEIHRINLALPLALYQKVQVMAALNHRSVTGQIISALEWTTREIKINEPTQHVQ